MSAATAAAPVAAATPRSGRQHRHPRRRARSRRPCVSGGSTPRSRRLPLRATRPPVGRQAWAGWGRAMGTPAACSSATLDRSELQIPAMILIASHTAGIFESVWHQLNSIVIDHRDQDSTARSPVPGLDGPTDSSLVRSPSAAHVVWHFRKKWTPFVGGARLTPAWGPVRGGTFRRACAFAYRTVRSRDKTPGHVGQLASGWRLPPACGPRGGREP